MTASGIGATVFTANAADFEAIRELRRNVPASPGASAAQVVKLAATSLSVPLYEKYFSPGE